MRRRIPPPWSHPGEISVPSVYPACNRVIRFAGLLEPSHRWRQASTDAEAERSAEQPTRIRHHRFFYAERVSRHEPNVLRVVFLGAIEVDANGEDSGPVRTLADDQSFVGQAAAVDAAGQSDRFQHAQVAVHR